MHVTACFQGLLPLSILSLFELATHCARARIEKKSLRQHSIFSGCSSHCNDVILLKIKMKLFVITCFLLSTIKIILSDYRTKT